MSFERKDGLVRRHSAAVVDDLDERSSGVLDYDADLALACIYSVFHQFLDNRCWPLNHLSGGYHIGYVAG